MKVVLLVVEGMKLERIVSTQELGDKLLFKGELFMLFHVGKQ